MKGDQERAMTEFEEARRNVAISAVAVSDVILDAAVKKMDALFGTGFAQANPALVGQYLDATTRTFQNDMAEFLDFEDDFEPLPPPEPRGRRR